MYSNIIATPSSVETILKQEPTGNLRINNGILEQEIYTVYCLGRMPTRDGRHWAVVPVGVWDASPLAPEGGRG